MTAIFSRRTSAALAAAFAVGLAVRAPAQEKPAEVAAPESPPASALSRAKVEFDGIKASRDAMLQPKRDLPMVVAPSFPVESPTITPVKPLKTPAPEMKSEHWLADAIRKQSESKPTRTKSDRSEDPTAKMKSGGLDLAPDSSGREAGRASDESRETGQKKDPVTVTNPLTRYLELWMTPKDYALLAPGILDSFSQGTDGKTGLASVGSAVAGIPSTREMTAGLLATAPKFSPPPSNENPYLQLQTGPMMTPIASSVRPLAPAALLPAPTVTTSPIDQASPVAPASKVPDFAKPAPDEKYFKQLKRF